MLFWTLFVALCVPARAAVDLRWAPALNDAMPALTGPARELARGFDGATVGGLQIRLNEIHALSRAGFANLASLSRRPAAVMDPGRLAALERSLTVFAPVIARLEARGIRIDDRGNASPGLVPALSRALEAEARDAERRARELAAHYDDERESGRALEDSLESDSLLRDRYPFLSLDALDRLARVHDSGRTALLASRVAAEGAQIALVEPDERGNMRDAVADPAPSFLERLAARVRNLVARLRARGR